MMTINRRRVMWKKGVPLPYDAEVEYIRVDSTGPLLSLDLLSTGTIETQLDWSVDEKKNNLTYGANISPDSNDYRTFWHPANNNLYFDVGDGRVLVNMSNYYTIGERFQLILGNLYITLPEKNVTVTGTTVSYTPYDNTSLHFGNKFTLYGVKIIDKTSNTKLRDMIPVRVGTVGYMYDSVSGELFGNDGTGAFIVGPDK